MDIIFKLTLMLWLMSSLAACAASSKTGYIAEKVEADDGWYFELQQGENQHEVKVSRMVYEYYEVGDLFPKSY